MGEGSYVYMQATKVLAAVATVESTTTAPPSCEVLAHFPLGLDLRDSELKFAETLDASGRGGGG
jgi:hypothetical protein